MHWQTLNPFYNYENLNFSKGLEAPKISNLQIFSSIVPKKLKIKSFNGALWYQLLCALTTYVK